MKRIASLFALCLLGAATLAAVAREPLTAPAGNGADPAGQLLILDLQGPSSAAPHSSERYTLIAHYADGSSVDVTERATWSVEPPLARVAGGVLVVPEAAGPDALTVTAWFSDGLALKASRRVTLTEPPPSEPRASRAPEAAPTAPGHDGQGT